ncbi:hypothetical protein L0152_13500 [bacterium]|nr:hypothetical protein [bacterium]
MNRTNRYMIVALCAITLLFTIGSQSGAKTKTSEKTLKFKDVQTQTAEFIGYYKSIKLTPEQEKLKTEVLSKIPAPCCTEYSIATCCCPCNLAKSVWGLSNYAIANLNYDAKKLNEAVLEWIKFTHKNGFAGDSCSKGRCGSSFAEDGCGGMKEGEIVF